MRKAQILGAASFFKAMQVSPQLYVVSFFWQIFEITMYFNISSIHKSSLSSKETEWKTENYLTLVYIFVKRKKKNEFIVFLGAGAEQFGMSNRRKPNIGKVK